MSRDYERSDRGSSRDGSGRDGSGRGRDDYDRGRGQDSRRTIDAGPQRVSLLIRNLPLDCKVEEIRGKFERYGEIRDVYMPRDYYTQRSRGFAFCEFCDSKDAEDALYALDRSVIGGREVSVVLSKESRKTPREMIKREDLYKTDVPVRGGLSPRSRSRSPPRRSSRSPRRTRDRSRSPSYSRSPRRRGSTHTRSRSPGR